MTNAGDKELISMTQCLSERPWSPNLFDIPIHTNQLELFPGKSKNKSQYLSNKLQ